MSSDGPRDRRKIGIEKINYKFTSHDVNDTYLTP